MKEKGVELLVIDELQHLRATQEKSLFLTSEEKGASALTDTLKTMLIRGLVPMVFIGIETAGALIFNDQQLAGRCIKKIDYDCLDYAVKSERTIFVNYCGRLGLKLRQCGLFKRDSNFIVDDIPACLHEASAGRIGIVSRIVENAATIAADQGSACVVREHLEQAVDAWAIPMKAIDYNPFRDGVRKAKLIKK